MPCCRHRTWLPTLSQYTDTGSTWHCAIHWCGTSHWNTQLPFLMSWVRPEWEMLPRSSTHPSKHSTDSGMVVVSWKLGRKFSISRVLNPVPVVCESITQSARLQLLITNPRPTSWGADTLNHKAYPNVVKQIVTDFFVFSPRISCTASVPPAHAAVFTAVPTADGTEAGSALKHGNQGRSVSHLTIPPHSTVQGGHSPGNFGKVVEKVFFMEKSGKFLKNC